MTMKTGAKMIYPQTGTDNNYVAIKKYVIGGAQDLGANGSAQHYPNNTYMMRLAEMYLIYAEAAIGNSNSTTDATAVAYFNAVHQRAGLPAWTVSGANSNGPLTLDAVLTERFKEFAMEGTVWYDLATLYYWNPSKALGIVNSQDRGLFYVQVDNINNPSQWTFTKTSWYSPRLVTANPGNFVMPIPAIELSQAPNLQGPIVDYL
jgi:starch-binding outer membrane protein, SusD/RagB family